MEHKVSYYRQPRYFRDFKCIGGACPNSCCQGWLIAWKTDEIEKVKAAEISDELRALLDDNFIPVNESEAKVIGADTNRVRLESGTLRCPFLTEENLCRIQKEAGADSLSYTCNMYPRKHNVINRAIYRSCHTTCTPVISALCDIENAADLVNAPLTKGADKIKATSVTGEKAIQKYPILKYHAELLEFFYGILYDKKYSFETAVMLGALAAQKITEFVSLGREDRIPEAIKAIRPQLRDERQIKALDAVKPNFKLKMSFMGEMFLIFMKKSFLITLCDGVVFSREKYDRAMKRFDEVFSGREYAMRNIALNIFLDLNMPFFDHEKTIFENYALFAACAGSIRVAGAAVAAVSLNASDKAIEDGFKYIIALISRILCHNPKHTEELFDILQNHKITSPAYIATLIK